jgi:hypothetical protein
VELSHNKAGDGLELLVVQNRIVLFSTHRQLRILKYSRIDLYGNNYLA